MSLRELAPTAGHQIIAIGRPEFDLAGDPEQIERAIIAQQPDLIISAAAYTAVDKAEGDPEQAYAVNVRGAAAIADAARQLGVPLLHLSTDYVFDGAKSTPYGEDDPTCPKSIYGKTKRDGEEAILRNYDDVAILRTAWVYSPFGNNFLKTMLRLAGDRDEVGVVADQRGNPTSALDIASGLLGIADNLIASQDRALRGIFHLAGSGTASWAEFASEIIARSETIGGPSARVREIETKDYPTPARRPANSTLDCSKLQSVHGIRMPEWKLSTAIVVNRLVASAGQERGIE
jgi:dTDP-4-dehydrorhamnose reductase